MTLERVTRDPLLSPSAPANIQREVSHQPALAGRSPLTVLHAASAVLICALAFLLAATPARNSDLWLHLASGRYLSQHGWPDGTDPFSSTTQGIFWVNHSWLSDLVFFWTYQLGGGAVLVAGKAVLAALLAALFFCFRRRGESVGVLALASGAALLALGPWLQLQPHLWSLLGVLVTLYLLERPNLLEGAAAVRARTERWLLVPMFALWANLDEWFLLGPVLLGLYLFGELLRRSRKDEGGRMKDESRHLLFLLHPSSFILVFAALAACLATPYHYRIFAWPTPLGLAPAEQAWSRDPLGQTLIFSPFGKRFVLSPIFHSPGAWAYYVLLAASGASFVLTFRSLHPGRLLVWLFLAALSIYQARTIPFFAVSAAPLLALNFQEWAAVRSFSEPRRRLWNTVQRVGVLVGIVLPVLAWPGWLQPAPYQPRRWTVEPDGSLVRLAEQLNHWHAEARWRPDRVALTFSPEVAHYLAWFCPDEKGFVDSRWPLFDRVAGDYVRMRRCLVEGIAAETGAELASLLDAHHIDRIVVYESDWGRVSRAYRHLFLDTPRWELLTIKGGATVFRRREGTTSSLKPFDFRHAAYHPALDQRAPPAPRPPQAPGLFDAFLPAPGDSSADREEAALYILSFDLGSESFALSWLLAKAIGVIGCGAAMEPTAAASALALRLHFPPPTPPSAPEPLLLAVRAARRALSINPNDGRAFLRLGQAYFRLARQTPEVGWQNMLPALSSLRRVQMLTTLEQAVLVRPDLDLAHALLAQLYVEPDRMFQEGQDDRCLDHLRARRRLAENAPERRDYLESDLQRLQALLAEAEKVYQANLAGKTAPSKVLARAQLAARYGLSRKALEMLQESYPAIYGKDGVEYQLELMLQAGQSYQVREVLEPKHEKQIDFFKYHWLKTRAAAACGDYEGADAELDQSCEPLRRIGFRRGLLLPVRSAMALRVTQAMLMRAPDGEGAAGRASAVHFQSQLIVPLEGTAAMLRQEADRDVLRGLLALEAGEVEAAQQRFRAALHVWSGENKPGGLDFPARPIAQTMLRQLHE